MRRLLIATLFAFHAALAAAAPGAPYRISGVDRIVVFPDVHGAYDPMVAILREAAVIDPSLHWSGGRTHLVGLGDLIDRGPDSRKVLDFLMQLEPEATAAGGAFHLILGNHEVMNIAGDLRYVTPPEFAAFAGDEDAAGRESTWKAILAKDSAASRAEFDTAFPPGYFGHLAAFAPDGRYGQWLMDKPYVLVINDTAFVHGGLPPMVASLGLEGTNETLHPALRGYLDAWRAMAGALGLVRPIGFQDRPDALAALPAPAEAAAISKLQDGALFTPEGPTWYRGQALCDSFTETANLDAALAKLGASRVIEGHTVSPTGRVLRRFDGRVVLLDAGMLAAEYHGRAAAMIFEDGQWSVAYADSPGQRFQPEAPPRAVGPRPRSLDDDALERWMAEAEVSGIENVGTGVTDAQRVTLRKDGVELRAVFKPHSATADVAAYRLDRLLGLDRVPVTVERTVGKRSGILQFWVDGSMNLKQMIEQKVAPSGWCPANPQYNLMNVFDLLIHNTGRTQQNALFTRDWMLVLIDHARAFGTDLKDPPLLYTNPVEIPPALARRLAALDRTSLDAAVGRYLNKRQIDALLKRRDDLLRRYGTAPAESQAAAR
jgi:hypothetical protein